MKIKTSELTGAALDWAVAKAENRIDKWIDLGNGRSAADIEPHHKQLWVYTGSRPDYEVWAPSRHWAQGGPIIEREAICIKQGKYIPTSAYIYKGDGYAAYLQGDTPLIAAMRCYVASKLGDEVEVPDDLA